MKRKCLRGIFHLYERPLALLTQPHKGRASCGFLVARIYRKVAPAFFDGMPAANFCKTSEVNASVGVRSLASPSLLDLPSDSSSGPVEACFPNRPLSSQLHYVRLQLNGYVHESL